MSARETARRWLAIAGSRPLSVALLGALILYLAMLAVWTFTSPPTVVGAIAAGIPYRIAYALIAINTLACIIQFWIPGWRRCRPYRLGGSELPADAQSLPISPGPELPRRLAMALRWRGFTVRRLSDGGLHATRGRFSALGTPLFHLSILVVALGLLVDRASGFTGTALVSEGQSFYGEPSEYLALDPSARDRAPRLAFRLDSIEPRFHRGKLFFTALTGRVEAPPGLGHLDEVRLSRGLAVGDGVATLEGFGYSLEYRLETGGTEAAESAVVNTMIFPPGMRDSFRLPDRPYTIFVELFPNYVRDPRGQPATAGVELRNPRLGVIVLRNRAVLAHRLVQLGERVEFDGLALVPVRLLGQGQFRVRSSPGVPVVGIGLLGMLVGLVWRVFRSRRELRLRASGGGGWEAWSDGDSLWSLPAGMAPAPPGGHL